jgi:hypothetical protein
MGSPVIFALNPHQVNPRNDHHFVGMVIMQEQFIVFDG